MYKLNSILLFSEDPKKLSEFYSKVFESAPHWTDGKYFQFKMGSLYLEIGPHSEVHGQNSHPERVLFNYHFKDVEAEFKRLNKIGVKVIQEPYHPKESPEITIATFADLDGNYFQLMTAWDELKKE